MSSVSDVNLRRAHVEWLAIPLERCPPNHYDLLSIALFEPDRNKIVEAGKLRQHSITRKSVGASDAVLANRIQADIRSAMNCLLNESTRAIYDESLTVQLQMEAARQPPPTVALPGVAQRNRATQQAAAPIYGSVSVQGQADPLAKFLTSNRLKGKKKNTPRLLLAGAAFLGMITLGGVIAMFIMPGGAPRPIAHHPSSPSSGPTTATETKTPTSASKHGDVAPSPDDTPSHGDGTPAATSEPTKEPALPSETSTTSDGSETLENIEAGHDDASASQVPKVISSDDPVVSLPSSHSTDPSTETTEPETTGNDSANTVVAATEGPESSGPPASSATEPVAFSEKAIGETAYSQPSDTHSTEEMPSVEWSAKGFIKAVELKPRKTSATGLERFRTHETLPAAWAVPHSESMRPAPRFISMKPCSEAVFKIPKGTTGFEAFAYSRLSAAGKFSIQAAKTKGNAPPQSDTEWETLEATPEMQYGELKVKLTPAHRYLRLVADARPNGNDQMYWVRPIFIVKSKRIIVSEKMLAAPVTGFPSYFGFGVHHSCHFTQPLDTKGKESCTELFYGHAPAEISVPVPVGSKRFTALVGGLEDFKDVEVSIKVDTQDEAIYHTLSPNWDEVDLELPDDAKTLTLIAAPLGNSHSDQVAWLYPRFHNQAASSKEKAKAEATWKKALAAGRVGTDPQLRISASCYAPETIASLSEIVQGIRIWNGIGVIPQLDDHRDAFLLHPDTADTSPTISFGRITSQTKGKLRLWTRNFPSHGDGPISHRTIVKRNGDVVEDFSCLRQEGWQELVIPFDHQYVTVEHQAVGWGGEHGCYDYEIVTGE